MNDAIQAKYKKGWVHDTSRETQYLLRTLKEIVKKSESKIQRTYTEKIRLVGKDERNSIQTKLVN